MAHNVYVVRDVKKWLSCNDHCFLCFVHVSTVELKALAVMHCTCTCLMGCRALNCSKKCAICSEME